MYPYKFTDEYCNEFVGDVAAERLDQTNDARFRSPGGVVKVSRARWDLAQRFESHVWETELGMSLGCDRNDEHLKLFDGYKVIAGRKFNSALEVGCGPFSNLRMIKWVCKIDSFTLLDPLVKQYLNHPNCPYVEGGEFDNPTLLDTPAEEYSGSHDMVVLVNTIDHVYDAQRVLDVAYDSLEPGGVIIFGEECWNGDNIDEVLECEYDAGHPIKLLKTALIPFFSKFNPLYHRTFVRTLVSGTENIFNRKKSMVYFIGEKR